MSGHFGPWGLEGLRVQVACPSPPLAPLRNAIITSKVRVGVACVVNCLPGVGCFLYFSFSYACVNEVYCRRRGGLAGVG